MRSLLVMFAILLLVLMIISSFGGSLSAKETFVDDTDEYAEEFYNSDEPTYPPEDASKNSTAPQFAPPTPMYDPYKEFTQKTETPSTPPPSEQPTKKMTLEYTQQSQGVVEPFEDDMENNYGPF